jgi:restriction endonuclease S subunit
MIAYWIQSDRVRGNVFIPKYYSPEIDRELRLLAKTHHCYAISDLIERGVITAQTGHEIGKNAYGTGDIPFVRTSDISNWEIKSSPKQGVSEDIYAEYAKRQQVSEGDILVVRDGTYLIGTNCFITKIDKELIYQSHLLKLRVNDEQELDPLILFLALNSPIVQKQIRSFQFTADIIDTIGSRFFDLILPIPKDKQIRHSLSQRATNALRTRMVGKAFIKHAPMLMESVLETGSISFMKSFVEASDETIVEALKHEAVSSEFGNFESYWHMSSDIKDLILIPRYYEPSIRIELDRLTEHCELRSFAELYSQGILTWNTGDEIGKMAYGTGNIPFLRTSDFANWEIKHDPKQGVSNAIYEEYSASEDVRVGDILLVRDGTYLVGSSCIITEEDEKSLFCGGLLKIRTTNPDVCDPYLLLGLLNSSIVKRQIRTKQFTRDVIDTIGHRLEEVILPIPRSFEVRRSVSAYIKQIIQSRISARKLIADLSKELVNASITSL